VPSGPAPGFRDSGWRETEGGSGKLYGVGLFGFSWSSSIAGTDAHYLSFHPTWLNPQSDSYRANGLQLRCLQE
jgi:hypothetical protein